MTIVNQTSIGFCHYTYALREFISIALSAEEGLAPIGAHVTAVSGQQGDPRLCTLVLYAAVCSALVNGCFLLIFFRTRGRQSVYLPPASGVRRSGSAPDVYAFWECHFCQGFH